jgi:hypothetical protein
LAESVEEGRDNRLFDLGTAEAVAKPRQVGQVEFLGIPSTLSDVYFENLASLVIVRQVDKKYFVQTPFTWAAKNTGYWTKNQYLQNRGFLFHYVHSFCGSGNE